MSNGVRWHAAVCARGGAEWKNAVKTRVTLEPTYEGLGLEALTVYLREFDPDDPSANNDVVDGTLTGDDNPSGRCSDAFRQVA